MIILRLMGGLGNQMFQYAFGRALALRTKSELKLDLSFLNNKENVTHTFRDYELSVFGLSSSIADPSEMKPYEKWKYGIKGKFRNIFPVFFPNKILQERSFRFDLDAYSFKGNGLAIGYWQSEKYFLDHAVQIRQDFIFKENLSEQNEKLIEKIKSVRSFSMHVRRGDMVHLASAASFHGTCSPHYYHAAVELIRERLGDIELFIFSDDPEYVKETFQFDLPTTIISHNTGKKSFEDMRLMSACKHHIIANSSFSWWGAWLNPDPDKIVIAPKQFFVKPDIDTTDIIPESWLRI